MAPSNEITRALIEYGKGNREALDHVIAGVYGELRKLAHSYLRRERPGQTLQTTALVHEAYLRLIDQHSVSWENRAHFFGVAAQAMRRILVDRARRRHAAKRDGGVRLALEDAAELGQPGEIDVVALDRALDKLGEIDPQQSRIVELRYFGGLSVNETGAVIGISPATVKREWAMARAWLFRELKG
jgi:RNA polymerase sigma factor (TIGR02999 family)